MQEGAAGGDDDALLANLGRGGLEGGEGGREVVLPHVAALDDAEGEHEAGGGLGEGVLELGGAADNVEVDGGDGEAEGEVEVGAEVGEVGGDDDLQGGDGGGEGGVGGSEGLALLVVEGEDEGGLVDLDPLGAEGGEAGQDLLVHAEERGEVGEDVAAVLLLAEQEEGDGADEDGAGGDAERLGLGVLIKDLGGGDGELGVGVELGDDEVVVGVEPLGHLHRGDVLEGAAAATAGHGKVRVDVNVAALEAVARGDGADEGNRVEDVVVQGEVVGGDVGDAGGLVVGPVVAADLAGGGEELLDRRLALPEGLDGLLKLALGANTGETKDGGGHC